jgi:hypothetical protein
MSAENAALPHKRRISSRASTSVLPQKARPELLAATICKYVRGAGLRSANAILTTRLRGFYPGFSGNRVPSGQRKTEMDAVRTLFEEIQLEPRFANGNPSPKLRVVLADGSPEYMNAVRALLELHAIVDLIGRAASIDEALQLTVNHAPDLLLIDLDMELAKLLNPVVVLSTSSSIRIVGICSGRTIPLDFLPSLDALIPRSRLSVELPSLIWAIDRSSSCAGYTAT